MTARDLYTDNVRRMLAAEARDPVTNAFHALAALSKEDRAEVCLMFNDTFARATPPMTMSIMVLK